FRRARGQDYAIDADRHPAAFVFVSHRFARGLDARRGRVSVMTVVHRARHGLHEMGRCHEAERNRIADVQVPHAPAASFDGFGFGNDVADGVGEAVDARRWADRSAGGHRTHTQLTTHNLQLT